MKVKTTDEKIKDAFDYAINFYSNNNRGLDNQFKCLHEMMRLTGLDDKTCVLIQDPILTVLRAQDVMNIGNETIQNLHRIVSGNLKNHMIDLGIKNFQHIPTSEMQSVIDRCPPEQSAITSRYQSIIKGFTGQVLGGAVYDERDKRDYSEKPQVNKEMLVAARKIDSEGTSKSVNFMLFHKHHLNDDDMYWLSSIFNTHTPKGLAVNMVDLSNNDIKLTRDHNLTYQDLPFFSFNSPYNTPRNIIRLDLSNNNIDDYGAKVIADGLANGVFPITKYVNLSGNKITDKGETFFVKVLKDPIVQRIAVLLEDLGQNLKIQSGKKEHIVPELNNILKKAQDRGVDVKNMVVDLSFLTWVKNIKGTTKIATKGFIKCKWTDDPVGDWAKGELAAKLPQKMGNFVKRTLDTESTVSCFIRAYDQAVTSEFGAQMAINDLYVIGENYVQDNME